MGFYAGKGLTPTTGLDPIGTGLENTVGFGLKGLSQGL